MKNLALALLLVGGIASVNAEVAEEVATDVRSMEQVEQVVADAPAELTRGIEENVAPTTEDVATDRSATFVEEEIAEEVAGE